MTTSFDFWEIYSFFLLSGRTERAGLGSRSPITRARGRFLCGSSRESVLWWCGEGVSRDRAVVIGALFSNAASFSNTLSALTSKMPADNATEESKRQELKSEWGLCQVCSWLIVTGGFINFYLFVSFAFFIMEFKDLLYVDRQPWDTSLICMMIPHGMQRFRV